MRSNFKSPLHIVGDKVEAGGELMWEPGEERSLVSVSISQKRHKVAGMRTSPNPFKHPAATWALNIKPGYEKTSFQPGLANAVGIICAMGDGVVDVFFWGQEVELK